jgi:8-oxo-dGTP diphosphatase
MPPGATRSRFPYATPLSAVDVLLFTCSHFWSERRAHGTPHLEIALVDRAQGPFAGTLALPGTVMRIEPDSEGNIDATDLDAARRVLRDKVGVRAPHLEQLYTWFTRDADPRGPATVIAYFALVPYDYFREVPPGRVHFKPVHELPKLPFIHNAIVTKGVERIRSRAAYSSLPALLMPETFSLRELQSLYESILGRSFDASNFAKRIEALGILEPVPRREEEKALTRIVQGRYVTRKPRIFRLKTKSLVTFERESFAPMARARGANPMKRSGAG